MWSFTILICNFTLYSKLHKPGSHTCCSWCSPKHGTKTYSRFLTRRTSAQAETPPKGNKHFQNVRARNTYFFFLKKGFSSRAKSRKHKSLHLCLHRHLLEWEQNWKLADTESRSTVQRIKQQFWSSSLGVRQSSAKNYLTLVSKVTFLGQKATAIPPC